MVNFNILGGKISLNGGKLPRPSEDALWLASAISPKRNELILEAGCGTGIISSALKTCYPHIVFDLVACDINFDASKITKQNILGISTLQADIISPPFANKTFSQTFANPPYHSNEKGFSSNLKLKQIAHGSSEVSMEKWINKMINLTKAGGIITLIHHAHNLELLKPIFKPYKTNICFLKSHIKKNPKRVIIQITKVEEPIISYSVVNTYEEKIREAILVNGNNLWQFAK